MQGVKIINFLNKIDECDEWTEFDVQKFSTIDIDKLAKHYENLLPTEKKKKNGVYYTPRPVTEYIVKNTVYPYLLDKINSKFKTRYKKIESFFEQETDEEKFKYFFEVLRGLKILDPSCGAGNFLITALEVLLELYDKLREKTKELEFEHKILNGLANLEDEEFKFHTKLHIIQNNLYGVDIDVKVVNLTKFRLYLSLARHFNKEKCMFVDFSDIDWKIKAGNSLIGFTKLPFLSNRTKISLNKDLLAYLKSRKIDLSEEDFERLGHFHWVLEFPEVLMSSGFDIIVGNPPYIRQERINRIVEGVNYKKVLSTLYDPYDNKFDLSMYFILRSLELLKIGGYHSFIITNKWMRAGYGKKMRQFLKRNVTIKKVIDLTGVKLFKATVDTMIYVVRKEKPSQNNKILYNQPKGLDFESGGYYVKQADLEDEVWNFLDDELMEIKKWIESVGVPLKDL